MFVVKGNTVVVPRTIAQNTCSPVVVSHDDVLDGAVFYRPQSTYTGISIYEHTVGPFMNSEKTYYQYDSRYSESPVGVFRCSICGTASCAAQLVQKDTLRIIGLCSEGECYICAACQSLIEVMINSRTVLAEINGMLFVLRGTVSANHAFEYIKRTNAIYATALQCINCMLHDEWKVKWLGSGEFSIHKHAFIVKRSRGITTYHVGHENLVIVNKEYEELARRIYADNPLRVIAMLTYSGAIGDTRGIISEANYDASEKTIDIDSSIRARATPDEYIVMAHVIDGYENHFRNWNE